MSDVALTPFVYEGPQSALEKQFIEKYLLGKNVHWADLSKMNPKEAQLLMKEACAYASLKLAEVEARAQFKQKIHFES